MSFAMRFGGNLLWVPLALILLTSLCSAKQINVQAERLGRTTSLYRELERKSSQESGAAAEKAELLRETITAIMLVAGKRVVTGIPVVTQQQTIRSS
ncbi:hypothetical protein [Bradyrhizobium sp. 169]|uniref:hypothetical protein n=1 Tax=Bradyrhizobium sp. 169 TaxID=2782640 RepID=UPI001FF981C1|nr:hypothetical protein [Bradyrhizobium sp. 169]MCK1592261.1 hypothetical protein [Bradyrhizobium sp. 169]